MKQLSMNNSIKLPLPNSTVIYNSSFLTPQQADIFYNTLLKETPWQQDNITLFGKTHLQPRLTALYGDSNKPYSYSGITMQPHVFTHTLLEIKEQVEKVALVKFTSCLLNYYRDGKDSNGWHSDDEKELGKNPVIASVSLGAPRMFHFRNKKDKTLKHKLQLEHGSLLLMQGTTQHYWQHQLPKTSKKVDGRINLTFRVII